MNEKKFITAEEIANEVDISLTYAYKIIKILNAELTEKGYFVFSGKISRAYFEERMYYKPADL